MKRPLLLQELAHVLIRLSNNSAKVSEKRVRRRTGIATTLKEAIRYALSHVRVKRYTR
jgi:hypothetical protein